MTDSEITDALAERVVLYRARQLPGFLHATQGYRDTTVGLDFTNSLGEVLSFYLRKCAPKKEGDFRGDQKYAMLIAQHPRFDAFSVGAELTDKLKHVNEKTTQFFRDKPEGSHIIFSIRSNPTPVFRNTVELDGISVKKFTSEFFRYCDRNRVER